MPILPLPSRLRGPHLSGVILGVSMHLSCAAASAAEHRFAFGPGDPPPGYVQIAPPTAYEAGRGFGYLRPPPAAGGPAVFAVDVPEGNRAGRVRDADVHGQRAEAGDRRHRPCDVVNAREKGPPPVPDWDDHLTLEFNGKRPGVASVEIRPATEAVTVFVTANSTVTDQAREPYAGWGQMLPRFFWPGVAVSNQAESGLSLFSFDRQKRLEKVLSMMKRGDYLFVQFGHNDQKDNSPGAGPFTSYKANLKRFVVAARAKGGNPVLVTPMERRRFDKDGNPTATLADYGDAVRQVGAEESVPVIDLNAMSLKLYAALGPEKSTRAFAHYPANTFPGQDKPLRDDTHHNTYGGYELARCVVEGIRAAVPALANEVVGDVGPFDPADPDPPEKVDIPASPFTGATERPAGSSG